MTKRSTSQHPRTGVFFAAFALTALAQWLWGGSAYALESHNLSGLVVDAGSSRPIANARILLPGESLTYHSAQDGRFLISDLPSGRYILKLGADGYFGISQLIDITDGPDSELLFRLTPIVFILPEQKVSASFPDGAFEGGSVIGSIELTSDQSISFRNAAEIVKKIPGIFIRENGPGGERTVSINGCDPSKVRVVFDGVILNGGSGMAVDLNTIPAASVGKVEVYAGNGSIGGTLILTSRRLADINEDDIALSGAIGSFNTNDFKAGIGISPRKIPLNMTIDRFHTDGDFQYTDQLGREKSRRNNYRDAENYFIKSALPFRNFPEISLQYYRAKKGSPGPLLQIDSTATIENRKLIANLTYKNEISKSSLVEIGASSLFLINDFKSTGGFIKYDIETSESRHSSSLRFHRKGTLKTELGIDYAYEDFQADDLRGQSNDIDLKVRRFLATKASTGFEKALSSSPIPVGIYSHLGGQEKLISSQKPSYTYDWDAGIYSSFLVRASLGAFGGTSFQLPDFYSLFFKEDIYAVGNPDLKPERGKLWGWRLGLALKNDFPMSAGYIFTKNRIEDIIIWKQRFDGKYSPTNVERALLTTGSLSFEIGDQNSPVNLEFQHSRFRPLNKSEFRLHKDKYLLFRPLHTASLLIAFGTADARLEINHQWVGKRFIRMENTVWLDAYQITSVSLLYRFGIGKARVSCRAEIDNLGNEPYEIMERYPSPPRNYFFGINVSL